MHCSETAEWVIISEAMSGIWETEPRTQLHLTEALITPYMTYNILIAIYIYIYIYINCHIQYDNKPRNFELTLCSFEYPVPVRLYLMFRMIESSKHCLSEHGRNGTYVPHMNDTYVKFGRTCAIKKASQVNFSHDRSCLWKGFCKSGLMSI